MLRVLSKLPSLRNLKLSDNGLQGPFPAEGMFFFQLITLYIYSGVWTCLCLISYLNLICAELGNFNNLEMLDLSANLFDASAPMQGN